MTEENQALSKPDSPAPAAKRGIKAAWQVVKDLWDEHDFWVNAGALRAGVWAIPGIVFVAVTYAVTLPFAAAALIVAGCGALIGLGIYGAAHGGIAVRKHLDAAWRRVTGKPPREEDKNAKPRRDVLQAARSHPLVKKFTALKPVQDFKKSRIFKKTLEYTTRQRRGMMNGLALGGSLASIGMGISLLITQVMVGWIVAIGVAVAGAIYMTTHGVIDHFKHLKKRRASEAAKNAAGAEESPASAVLADAAPAAAPFNAAAQNSPAASGDLDKKKDDPQPRPTIA